MVGDTYTAGGEWCKKYLLWQAQAFRCKIYIWSALPPSPDPAFSAINSCPLSRGACMPARRFSTPNQTRGVIAIGKTLEQIRPDLPVLTGPVPGPRASAIIGRDAKVVSPSYTRCYPLVA